MTYPVEFEWDEAKNRANQRKHGLSFEDARRLLESNEGLESLDEEHSVTEERIMVLGEIDGVLASVVYTEREEGRVRIISARPADRREKLRYRQHVDQYG